MKPFWILIILSLFGGFYTAQAQTVLERRMVLSSAVENEVFSLVFDNPAMKYLQHTTTLNALHLGGEYQKEDLPTLMQEGDGLRFGSVNVSSYIHKKNNSLWGQAYYKNGEKLGRCWNETSDYKLLYPYVMGDTLGGDLKSEQYFFKGGYAGNIGKYLVGVEGAYKATIEYRNADPRPKNLTGDLNIRLGLSRYLGDDFVLGTAFSARKYKQTNDLVFYNELGVPNIYHFTGLGTDYYRFRGAKGESFYKGHAFGGSIDLLPVQKKGISAALHYTHFQFEKVISTLNELPMASVKENDIRTELAWRQQSGSEWRWGIKGAAQYVRRVGAENLFGPSTGNIFPQISTQEKYMNKVFAVDGSGVLEYISAKGVRATLLPRLGFVKIETSYNSPSKQMKVAMLQPDIRFRLDYPCQQWLLSCEAGAVARFNVDSQLDIQNGVRPTDQSLTIPVQSNYDALKATRGGGHLQIRTDYSWNTKYAVYLAMQYQYSKDRRTSVSHYVGGQIGFLF